jgi:hypothetical protein
MVCPSSDQLYAGVKNMPPPLPAAWGVVPRTEAVTLDDGRTLGQGFLDLVPKGLPSCSVEVFLNLAWVSYVIEQPGRLITNPRDLDDMRSDAHHRVMSLSSLANIKDELDDAIGQLYECLRLCTVMFSCAVIFPLPTDDDWPRELCTQLREVMHQLSACGCYGPHAEAVKWCLLMASMTGLEYEHRDEYLARLGSHLNEDDDWTALQNIGSWFIWSNIACNDGAKRLWQDLSHSVIQFSLPLSYRTGTGAYGHELAGRWADQYAMRLAGRTVNGFEGVHDFRAR